LSGFAADSHSRCIAHRSKHSNEYQNCDWRSPPYHYNGFFGSSTPSQTRNLHPIDYLRQRRLSSRLLGGVATQKEVRSGTHLGFLDQLRYVDILKLRLDIPINSLFKSGSRYSGAAVGPRRYAPIDVVQLRVPPHIENLPRPTHSNHIYFYWYIFSPTSYPRSPYRNSRPYCI
jgi:hypothetical protein